jgi:hypothetical protein
LVINRFAWYNKLMSDVTLAVVLTALVLLYVSFLTYIRLSSQGVAPARITLLIGEVWGIFALIIFAFALISARLGSVPRSSVVNELVLQFSHIRRLPGAWQALAIMLLAIAVILFAHLLWTLRNAERDAQRGSESHIGNSDQ